MTLVRAVPVAGGKSQTRESSTGNRMEKLQLVQRERPKKLVKEIIVAHRTKCLKVRGYTYFCAEPSEEPI